MIVLADWDRKLIFKMTDDGKMLSATTFKQASDVSGYITNVFGKSTIAYTPVPDQDANIYSKIREDIFEIASVCYQNASQFVPMAQKEMF